MVYWHPHGWTVFRLLEDAIRAHVARLGFREVRTPQLLPRKVWEASGHWGKFADGMFMLGARGDGAGALVDAALKPVNCPGAIAIVKKHAPSWRDLPIRISEIGVVHRDEDSGALNGLFRLRQFTQDDGHVFCSDDQMPAEIERFIRDVPAFYRGFGFEEVSVALSLRPEKRLGDDARWDRAERVLRDIVVGLGVPIAEQPGAGAIYGPKLEFVLRDRRGRSWQCGTVQLDLVMPERFDLRYVDSRGDRQLFVMLHRALFGSFERFIALLLERHDGALPAWLAPEQVMFAPVGEAHLERAHEVAALAAERGLRVRVDAEGTVARRIAQAHHDGVPFAVVIGDRELAEGSLSARAGERRWSGPVDRVLDDLQRECAREQVGVNEKLG
jgi:threonyl-tRNA synthetase